MTEYKLAIDLGSTEFKAAVYTDDMRLLGSAAHKLSYDRNGAKVELPVEPVLKAFAGIIGKSVESAGIGIGKVSSIGVTSQAQTFAVADENGVFLTPFISWLDMRASETYKTIALNDFAKHSSIAEILPNMRISILKHLLYEKPEIAKEKIKIISLPAYLIMLLTGKCVSDNNIAAMSGIFSLKENDYWRPALELLRLDKDNFPEIIEVGTIAGKTRKDNSFGLPDGVPVFSCGNDQTAGAFGAGLNVGDVLITLGTAQTVYCCFKTMPDGVQFRGQYPGGLYYGMFAGTGGDLITKAIEKVPEFKDFDNFAELAAKTDTHADAGFYVKNAEIGWTNDSPGLSEKASGVLNFLADEILNFFKKLTGNSSMVKTIYIAGGGRKIPAWINAVENKLQYKLKSVEASPVQGVAQMINGTN